MVPPTERQAYEEKTLQPPNIGLEAVSGSNFRYDVLGSPSSPWNKSAARVFANLAIDQLGLPNTSEMFEAIRQGFKKYLETIIRRYKASLLSSAVQKEKRSLKSRYTRKYQVFKFLYHRRRFLAYTFKPLQRHIDMVEYLGVDGMSSDESDVDSNHQLQYRILTPIWRASEVAA
ncbi:hypothetical protein C8J57DRAFT_1101892 [Mycena rebaudengoi]|nr:hypothetical protein C8J57DRAFT_1101892 [Mycena rebaudengoi]